MTTHRKTPRARVLAAAAFLALAGFACDGDDGGNPAEDLPADERPTDTGTPQGNVPGREQVRVELVDNEYQPNEIQVTGGEIVTFMLENTGDNGHTFTVDDLDIDVELQFGQKSRVDLNLPDDGEVEFYCRFHRDQGMTGVITLE